MHFPLQSLKDERDTFAVRWLLILTVLLPVSSYLYRSLVTNQAYEQPFAKILRPTVVQSPEQGATE